MFSGIRFLKLEELFFIQHEMVSDVRLTYGRCHQKDVILHSTCSLPSVSSWIWKEQASNYGVVVLAVVGFLRFC